MDLLRMAKRIYEKIPYRCRWLVWPLYSLYRAYDSLRPRFYLVQDKTPGPESGRMILLAAHDTDRNYLAGHVLGEVYGERSLGRVWLWNISRFAAKAGKGCCMVIVQVPRPLCGLLPRDKWLCIPGWVRGEVDIPLSPTVLSSETVRSDLRRIRRHSLGFKVTRDVSLLEDFYRHMYVPHVRQAHGNAARIIPYEHIRRMFNHCELLLVMQQDRPLAGVLIEYSKRLARLVFVGVRDANRDYIGYGAISAVYHYSLQHLEGKGFRKMGLGYSRPFFKDGVLAYKKKLGMRTSGAFGDYFLLQVLDDTEALRGILQNLPLIFERNGLLYGAVFVAANENPPQVDDFRRFARAFFMNGLSKVMVVPLGSFDRIDTIPMDLADRLEICKASDLPGFGGEGMRV